MDSTLFDLKLIHWMMLAFFALLVGASKGGLRGVNIVMIPFLAVVFGGKSSSGLVLPLLVSGDIMAVILYRKEVDWSSLRKLLPAAVTGILIGMVVGHAIPDRLFQILMGCILVLCLVLMLWKEFGARGWIPPDHFLYHGGFGILGGFSTMVGNSASPIMNLYMLSMGMPKQLFLGTVSVFFFIINIFKLPLHAFYWGSITGSSLLIDLSLVPFVISGFFLGAKIVRYLPERPFRIFIIVTTSLGVLKLFLS